MQGRGKAYDPTITKVLVAMLGIYPMSAVVKLSDASTAVVFRVNRDDLLQDGDWNREGSQSTIALSRNLWSLASEWGAGVTFTSLLDRDCGSTPAAQSKRSHRGCAFDCALAAMARQFADAVVLCRFLLSVVDDGLP